MRAVFDLSLGEAEALVTKAARGAGRPWGLAAEAGRAFRRAVVAGREDAPALFVRWLGGGDRGVDCPLRLGLFAAEGGRVDTPEGEPEALVFAAAADLLGAPPGGAARCLMEAAPHARLEALAQRTYAPATEESRRRGAG